jgi:hypothetical protein
LGINRPNGLNCYNLKVWGVKCHILNFEGKSENGWILQGVKCNFPFFLWTLKEFPSNWVEGISFNLVYKSDMCSFF